MGLFQKKCQSFYDIVGSEINQMIQLIQLVVEIPGFSHVLRVFKNIPSG